MDLFEKCIEIACKAHFGQKDKAGQHYICHPFIVSFHARRHSNEAQCVAMLHDVLEDSNITAEQLVNDYKIPSRVVDAVVILTKQKGERYDYYLDRILSSENMLSIVVKREDLRHNLHHSRQEALSEKQREKYKEALNKMEMYLLKSYEKIQERLSSLSNI